MARSKCSLKYLEARLKEMSVDWCGLWRDIIAVCLKTLYCVQDAIPVALALPPAPSSASCPFAVSDSPLHSVGDIASSFGMQALRKLVDI